MNGLSNAANSNKPRPPGRRPLLVISANSSWNLLNFSAGLIRGLQRAGYSLAAMVPLDDGRDALEVAGVSVHTVPLNQHSLSPVSDLRLLTSYARQLRQMRPAAFLGITAKPNIYGSIAAQLAGVPVVNTVTGLGTGFLSSRLLEFIISALYWAAFRRSHKVFFLNRDDRDLFVGRRLVNSKIAEIIPGSGIDLHQFKEVRTKREGPLTFLFVGRILTDKGVREYLEAALVVKQQMPDVRFHILGQTDPHPRALPVNVLQQYEKDGAVEFLGKTDDVRPYIAKAHCVVLPSYREGLPRVLVEASAMARPMIASDVAGCRDVIEHGITGYLCKSRSAKALATTMLKFAHDTPEQRAKMGQAARRKAEAEFGDEHVVRAYVSTLHMLGVK